MFASNVITRIQSVILASIIIVAAVAGSLAYVLWNNQDTSETIKVGVLADLDTGAGKGMWQNVVLAAEQLNAEGGILGKQVEVVGEDSDISSGVDAMKIKLALTRLLTYHKVDFVIGSAGSEGFMAQEVLAEHKKIFFEISASQDEFTQRVLDDYDKCKYYFRENMNESTAFNGISYTLVHLRELTGFNRIGYIGEDIGFWRGLMQGLDYVLPELGFDLVYKEAFPLETFDFSSYFASAEAAGVEILVPLIFQTGAIPFVKEYHDRQSPMIIYGGNLGGGVGELNGWEITDGKCEYTSVMGSALKAGIFVTSKSLPYWEAYIERWSEEPAVGGSCYDILRYVLSDAIERAGTLEVDAVIEALETTSVETVHERKFVFTPSHQKMVSLDSNDPNAADYESVMYFQWIDGNFVPVFPKWLMEETVATFTFPPWPGPWD